jgi:CBS domain-containing protein
MTRLSSIVPVANIMTRRVHTAGPDASLEEILELLKKERCHHVPIVEKDLPIGMVSARDVVHLARRGEGEKFCIDVESGKCARDFMSGNLITIHVDESVDLAIERIGRGDIHALVVIDDDDRLAGIVTHRDLLAYLMD